MTAKKRSKGGKAAFALAVLFTLALCLLLWMYAGGRDTLSSLLAQTQSVDAEGRLSEYDALMGHPAYALTQAPQAAEEKSAPPSERAEGEADAVAPRAPERPHSAAGAPR